MGTRIVRAVIRWGENLRLTRSAAWAAGLVAALTLCVPHVRSQTVPGTPTGGAPAPRRDISGIWTPARGPGDGIGTRGARDVPDDGRPEHQLPYTAMALEKMKSYKPGGGAREVPAHEVNDPSMIYCDPQGMPRQNLYELRDTQILQTPLSVVVLYQYSRIWRVIWADGRDVPKNPDPRWFGHSVGKWVDDYTFVAQTVGTDERTWIDKAGRPLRHEWRARRGQR